MVAAPRLTDQMSTTNQLNLFKPARREPSALLEWKTLCDEAPAVWEWMECVGGFMPRDAEGYALIDSRLIANPRLHKTTWGPRWDHFG